MSKKKTKPKFDPKASKKPVPAPPPQQLVIFAPPHLTLEALPLVKGAKIAAIIFALPFSDTRSNITHFKNFMHPFQDLGIACFVENDAEVAIKSGADGVHITNHAMLGDALRLTPQISVGLGNVPSRDEAFILGDNPVDYMMFGDADDTEKLMQLLLSDELRLRVADAFDLWKRWKIKDSLLRYHYLKLTWEDMVVVKRTEFNSVRVEVHDYDAMGASIIANGIVDYCDSVRYRMNREISAKVVKIVKDEYDLTLTRMKELEDSLYKLRQLGVLHYKEQVKAYSKSHARALEKNDVNAVKRLEAKLDTLKKYGSAYQNTKDNLEKYASKYPDIKMKYDEALVNHRAQIPIKFVVDRAMPNEYKSKPKRMIIVALGVIATNLLGLFFLLLREKFGKLSK
jgi:hypothetical protein